MSENTTIDALRQIFRDMDARQAQEIREAYYKAVEGLMTLVETLEIADAQQPVSAGPLLTEHFYAVEALDAMRKSRLWGQCYKPLVRLMPRTLRTDALLFLVTVATERDPCLTPVRGIGMKR